MKNEFSDKTGVADIAGARRSEYRGRGRPKKQAMFLIFIPLAVYSSDRCTLESSNVRAAERSGEIL